MTRSLAPLALLLGALPAAAQVATPQPRATGAGLALPAEGAASSDGTAATLVNPAGLYFLNSFELGYVHQRSILGDRTGDGVFGAYGFDELAIGVDAQWIRPGPGAGGVNFRKTGLTLALGGETLAVGAAYHVFSSNDSPALDRLGGLDLGVTLRPCRGFAFGASLLNADAQHFEGVRLPRRLDLGVAFRPLGERLMVSADFLVDDDGGFKNGALAYNAGFRIIDGLNLKGGVTHYYNDGTLAATLGVELDTGLFALGYAAAVDGKLTGADHMAWARVTGAHHPALHLGGRYAVLDLGDLLGSKSSGLGALFGGASGDRFISLMQLLLRARRDETVAGVVLKIGDAADSLGMARIQELRSEIARLQAAGKPVVALLANADDATYFLASACKKVFVEPEATLLINGLSSDTVFVGDLLGHLGVKVNVARVGAYKNAPDQLTRGTMSDEQREALSAYLDTSWTEYVSGVSRDRGLDPEKFKAALQPGILSPQQAQALGLIDGIVFPDQLKDEVGKAVGASVRLVNDYASATLSPDRWGSLPHVALVRIVGNITEGKSAGGSLGSGESAGSETVVAALDAARTDSEVHAIVVRVDSPGGSGQASMLIERAIERAREKKPVVISMGNYAASGGYMVSMGGDVIFAEPATLTGSIGVFVIKPDVSGLLQHLSIGSETVKRGDHADIFDMDHGWDEAEQKVMQGYADDFYDRFITLVSQRRGLDKAAVDAVARGRVWSGQDALARKLVDQLGSLDDALLEAKKRAGLEADALVSLEVVGSPKPSIGGPLSPLLGRVASEVGLGTPADPLLDVLQPLGLAGPAGQAARALMLARTPGVVAALPFEVTVK
jgi:protease-4